MTHNNLAAWWTEKGTTHISHYPEKMPDAASMHRPTSVLLSLMLLFISILILLRFIDYVVCL